VSRVEELEVPAAVVSSPREVTGVELDGCADGERGAPAWGVIRQEGEGYWGRTTVACVMDASATRQLALLAKQGEKILTVGIVLL
jgi:hypothetical protein